MPKPLPAAMNSALNEVTNTCYYHLFYKKQYSNDLKYVSSLSSTWDNIFKTIEKSIADSKLGTVGIKIGVLKDENIPPELLNESNFSKYPFNYAQNTMIFVASSVQECNFVYRILKVLF